MKKELAKTYDPKGIEDRLYKKWEDNKYFHAEVDETKKPFTIIRGIKFLFRSIPNIFSCMRMPRRQLWRNWSKSTR